MGLSPDGLQICVGTETGTIGSLDIATHCHATLLRSHTGGVNSIAVSPVSNTEFCTASSDGSVRIWSLPNCVQLYQFESSGEKALSVAYSPQGSIIAAGFDNGKLRVFNSAGTMLLQVPTSILNYTQLFGLNCGFLHNGFFVVFSPNQLQYLFACLRGCTCKKKVLMKKMYRISSVSCFDIRLSYTGTGSGFCVKEVFVLQECVQHKGDVIWTQFSSTGDCLYSMGTDGNICLYDATRSYVPSKYVSSSEPSKLVRAAFSLDSKWLAATSYKCGTPGVSILIYTAPALEPHLRIETNVQEFAR